MTGSQVSQNSGQPCSNSSGCPAPGPRDMERRAIGPNRQMLHFWLLFCVPGPGTEFLAPRLVWPAILA